MQNFNIEMDNPIPSCQINYLKFVDNEWKYVYEIKNKGDKNFGNGEFLIYSHISNLTITNIVNKGSINIKISSIDELKSILEKQRLSDNEYRETWIANNPDYMEKVIIYTCKNETHKPKFRYIIRELCRNENETTFIVAI